MSLWATKSVAALRAEADATGERSLKRTLGALNLTMLGIGAIIGAGIFVLTGLAAALHAGPAVPLSFVVAAVACGLAGLCYAEMASAVPVAGSAYTYSYATMGEFVAWIIGWDLVLEYAMGAATVGVGWSGYFVSMLDYFGIHLPAAITSAPLRFCTAADVANAVTACVHPGWNPTGSLFNLPAMVIVLLATYDAGRRHQGVGQGQQPDRDPQDRGGAAVHPVRLPATSIPDNWHPFIPPNTGTFGEFGWSGVFRGAGPDLLRLHRLRRGEHGGAGGARIRRRTCRSASSGSLVICTMLYIVVSLTLTGLVRYDRLNVAHPVAYAVEQIQQLSWLRPLHHHRRGARPRLGGAGDAAGPEPGVLLDVARRAASGPGPARSTPGSGRRISRTIYVGIIVAVITGTFPIQILGELVNIGTLLAFVLVCAGVLDPPEDAARPRAAVPDAARAARADPRHPGLPRPHGHPAGRHLAPAVRLAR